MADAATPQASALQQPRFWTLDRVADALGDGPRGPTALTRIATDTAAKIKSPAVIRVAHGIVAGAVQLPPTDSNVL